MTLKFDPVLKGIYLRHEICPHIAQLSGQLPRDVVNGAFNRPFATKSIMFDLDGTKCR